jgi:hypothetical protein
MSDEWITWLVRLFRRPSLSPPTEAVDLRQIDSRLEAVEQKTDEIEARLDLLDTQIDIRRGKP